MAVVALFVFMIILASILLLVASLTSSLGAADAFNSSLYNSDPNLRSAHNYLTIAAALGWSALVVLIVVLIVGFFAGGFTIAEVSEVLLHDPTPSAEELARVKAGEEVMARSYTTQITVLVIFILINIVTLIVGILAVMAAIAINNMKNRDASANAAYTQAVAASVTGLGGTGLLFVAIIAYISIRAARAENLKETEKFLQEHGAK